MLSLLEAFGLNISKLFQMFESSLTKKKTLKTPTDFCVCAKSFKISFYKSQSNFKILLEKLKRPRNPTYFNFVININLNSILLNKKTNVFPLVIISKRSPWTILFILFLIEFNFYSFPFRLKSLMSFCNSSGKFSPFKRSA